MDAFAVGLAVMILGLIIMWIAKITFPQSNFSGLFSHAVMLFILGIALYLFSEFLGINAWYCQRR